MATEQRKLEKKPITIQTERKVDPDFIKRAAAIQSFLQENFEKGKEKTKTVSKNVVATAKDILRGVVKETAEAGKVGNIQREVSRLKDEANNPETTKERRIQIQARLKVLEREETKNFQEASERLFPNPGGIYKK